jgi:hypothetical protein
MSTESGLPAFFSTLSAAPLSKVGPQDVELEETLSNVQYILSTLTANRGVRCFSAVQSWRAESVRVHYDPMHKDGWAGGTLSSM